MTKLQLLILAGGILLTPPVKAESPRLRSLRANLQESNRVLEINKQDFLAARDAYKKSVAEYHIAGKLLKLATKAERVEDAQIVSTIKSRTIEGATPQYDQEDSGTGIRLLNQGS